MSNTRKSHLVLLFLLALVPVGCKEQAPELRVQNASGDAVDKQGAQSAETGEAEVVQDLGPNAKIVGGEPATIVEEHEEAEAADAKTAEDKTGAVAVKMEY